MNASPSLPAAPRDASPRSARPLTIALAGNPNAGKTSLFNALTGLRQKVANYPGVTVERKEGMWLLPAAAGPQTARLIDLPGLYSLEATSLDERIARDVMLGRLPTEPAPDVIVAVVDATNLERNLYLVTQLLETSRPLVVALTMCDLATRRGLELDAEQLSQNLGVPVVAVVATQRRGLDALAAAGLCAADAECRGGVGWRLSDATEQELTALANPQNGHGQVESAPAAESARRHAALVELYTDE